MKQITLFILCLAIILTTSFALAQGTGTPVKTTEREATAQEAWLVAILNFKNNSNDKSLDVLSKGLAEMLITDLSLFENIQILEREEIQKILKEMELSMLGIVDDSMALQIGKVYSAKYLLMGGYLNSVPVSALMQE